jgi:hypothetical protein
MKQPSKPSATYQDILDLPETLVGEIINGRLVTRPKLAAKPLHAKDQLGALLSFHFGHTSHDHPPSQNKNK